VTLNIEARDLDTDERVRASREVPAPSDPGEQRAAIRSAVAELYPTARLRSFAAGAATLLDRQHLIVASFAEGSLRRRPQPARQDPLFTA
jgi:hypothetical protein